MVFVKEGKAYGALNNAVLWSLEGFVLLRSPGPVTTRPCEVPEGLSLCGEVGYKAGDKIDETEETLNFGYVAGGFKVLDCIHFLT